MFSIHSVPTCHQEQILSHQTWMWVHCLQLPQSHIMLGLFWPQPNNHMYQYKQNWLRAKLSAFKVVHFNFLLYVIYATSDKCYDIFNFINFCWIQRELTNQNQASGCSCHGNGKWCKDHVPHPTPPNWHIFLIWLIKPNRAFGDLLQRCHGGDK